MPPYRPTQLGQWEVIAKIAGGGMSAVYLGKRLEPLPDEPNVVALKIVRHDARMNERMLRMFLEEGRLIARLDHPNIVRTLEVAGDGEQEYIAMELMLGKTFASIHDAISSRGVRLNPDIVAWTAARIADALHYAHQLPDEDGKPLGLVHRDVNPANLFATFQGDVKLFDFGLAKSTAGEVAGTKTIAGKLSYLSPEQIMAMPLDRRSDVFSLGTTLWELLTSRRLFRRAVDADTVRAVQLGPIPDPRVVAPEVPEELARIVKKALERNREHRYATAAHLAEDLDAFTSGRTSAADVTARIAQLVDRLFPGEQKLQIGWLKPSPSRQMMAVSPPASKRSPDSSQRALDLTARDGVPVFDPAPLPISSRPASIRPPPPPPPLPPPPSKPLTSSVPPRPSVIPQNRPKRAAVPLPSRASRPPPPPPPRPAPSSAKSFALGAAVDSDTQVDLPVPPEFGKKK